MPNGLRNGRGCRKRNGKPERLRIQAGRYGSSGKGDKSSQEISYNLQRGPGKGIPRLCSAQGRQQRSSGSPLQKVPETELPETDGRLFTAGIQMIIMDDTDRKIISLLRKNSRTAFVRVAERTGLTEGAVRARVKALVLS